jgi:tetratricopeptide (TPR) repeat protein
VVLNKTKNDIDKAKLLNVIADEYKSSDPKKMLQYANEALQLSTKIRFKAAEGNAYLNIGTANIITGNYTEALKNFSNAQVVFENELNTTSENTKELKNSLARAYGSIGIVFSEQSSYAKALQYELKALKIYEETKNLEKCARLYNNIGIVYKAQDADFKALSYFVKCLKIQEKIGD